MKKPAIWNKRAVRKQEGSHERKKGREQQRDLDEKCGRKENTATNSLKEKKGAEKSLRLG